MSYPDRLFNYSIFPNCLSSISSSVGLFPRLPLNNLAINNALINAAPTINKIILRSLSFTMKLKIKKRAALISSINVITFFCSLSLTFLVSFIIKICTFSYILINYGSQGILLLVQKNVLPNLFYDFPFLLRLESWYVRSSLPFHAQQLPVYN